MLLSDEGISQPLHGLAPSLDAKGQGSWISWQQVYKVADSRWMLSMKSHSHHLVLSILSLERRTNSSTSDAKSNLIRDSMTSSLEFNPILTLAVHASERVIANSIRRNERPCEVSNTNRRKQSTIILPHSIGIVLYQVVKVFPKFKELLDAVFVTCFLRSLPSKYVQSALSALEFFSSGQDWNYVDFRL
jgi:hypothetical protein